MPGRTRTNDLYAVHCRMHDIISEIVESGRAKRGLPDDYQALVAVLEESLDAIARADAARKEAKRDRRRIQKTIYDALDNIRFHPVVADYLGRDEVDSERWYKDSWRILEGLVARLLPEGMRPRNS